MDSFETKIFHIFHELLKIIHIGLKHLEHNKHFNLLLPQMYLSSLMFVEDLNIMFITSGKSIFEIIIIGDS